MVVLDLNVKGLHLARQAWPVTADAFAPLLDAEYGSGTFQSADRPGTFEVRVSTTGLLIRPRDQG